MAAPKGFTDTDKGLKEIRGQISLFSKKRIKAGIPKGGPSKDGVLVSDYAAKNEYGVPGPPYSENGKGVWFIPPRPFIRGWLAAKEENIKATMEKLGAAVAGGRMDADSALQRLGQFAQDGIKNYIMTGDFVENAERTKRMKHNSSKPLIDARTMLREIRYEIIGKDEPVEGPVEG
jgi:hypothetical protein